METRAATTSSAFLRWEEVNVWSEKGRREVHYYLKRRDGNSDLAVVGKEKSLRHMTYHYGVRDPYLFSISPSAPVKLKSRREVIDWLNSIVPGLPAQQTSCLVGGSLDRGESHELDAEALKDVRLRKLGHFTKEFIWLGPSVTCRKRRQHYQSFRRNGVKISVHDFVYVLAEENKRLVAYLEDMYEDVRGNKMVVVRWFHKIDEVGIDLPRNYNDREIFFSLCLQDLSIECIDGLATVLSPEHYMKFLNEAVHTLLEPFICRKQFDNDDVKSFDISKVKGYWKQEIIRYMYPAAPSKASLKSQPCDLRVEENFTDAVGVRPKKRLRRVKDADLNLCHTDKQRCFGKGNYPDNMTGQKDGNEVSSVSEMCIAAPQTEKEAILQKYLWQLSINSQVEVLSQDSGIRGCWFRAVIVKKHKDKVKVRYQDIKDALDETNSLEEWVLASKIAVPDNLGIRISGRTTVRPIPLSNKMSFSQAVNVGNAVDVWRHDGWWEGIVFKKDAEDRYHIYFPGEKQESIFCRGDLRHSQEWLGNMWKDIKSRPDVAGAILADLETKQVMVESCNYKPGQAAINYKRHLDSVDRQNNLSVKDEVRCSQNPCETAVESKVKVLEVVRDLSKDELLVQLRWNSSKKRRRNENAVQKLHHGGNDNKSSPEAVSIHSREKFYLPAHLKVDCENCKYVGDSLFGSSVVPPLTSLVMSR